MKTRLLFATSLFATSLIATLVAAPGPALGSGSRAASNNQTFLDSTGEDANAPDITSVNVSNDDSGNIVFKVNIANRPALTGDMLIALVINADDNTATGDPDAGGAEFIIYLVNGADELEQWTGSDYASAQSQSSLAYSYDATGATVRISQADLNGTKAFSFYVRAFSGITFDAQGNADFSNAHSDTAPDTGHGSYEYKVIAQLKLTQTAFTTAPNPARAGKRLTASLGANESDSNGPVTAGAVSCAATVAGKHLNSTHSLRNGIASCSWLLPKTAKGKRLYATITLTVQGTKLAKSFTAKVR
jgi:hypothetical protein